MIPLIWSPHALLDLQRLYRFLAQSNITAARRAVAAVRGEVRILASQPEIGRPIVEMGFEFREWLISFGDSGYAVLYRFDGAQLIILAVRHQREAGY